MKEFAKYAIGVVVILFVLSLLIIPNLTKESELRDISLRHSWIIDVNTAGYITAIEKGFYEEEGLNVNIHPGGVDSNPITMVISGSDDFGNIAGAEELIVARDKGIPIKGVFATHQNNAYVFITKKDSGITSPEQFADKKVFVQYGKSSEIIFRALMSKLDVDTSNIEEVPLKFDYTQFLNDDIPIAPAFVNNQPVTFEEKGFELNIIKPSDYGITSYGYVIITKEETIKNDPELVRAFVQATLKGWEYALANREEAVDLVLKYNSELDREFQLKVLDKAADLIDTGKPIGSMEKEKWEITRDILFEQELINQRENAEDIYTSVFLDD